MWSCSSAGTTGTRHARTGTDTGGAMTPAGVGPWAQACGGAWRR